MSLDPCRSWRGWRRRKRAPERLALAPTRRSCTLRCKEQPETRESSRRSFPTAPGWSELSVGAPRDFPLRHAERAWFGPWVRLRTQHALRMRVRSKKPDGGIPPGPAGAVLVNTLFSKILVTRVNRKICRAGGLRARDRQRRGGSAAPPQRRHSMATNSPRADVPVVVGTAPAISSRSILRNDAAST